MNIISDMQLKHFANAIRKFGTDTEFSRRTVDEYGEPGEPVKFNLRGIFHHTGETHHAFDQSDSGKYQRRKEYFLLSLDPAGAEDDICEIDGTKFLVTDREDIGMEGRLFEYSLEHYKEKNDV